MTHYELVAPCHMGLEAVLKREIIDLGYDITEVADGRVTFAGDADAVVRANIGLRTAERVLIKIGSFHAESYEELFQGTKALPLEEFIPVDGKFWVTKASTVKSKVFSPSDIQRVMKKAMVDRMSQAYHTTVFEENGLEFPIRVFLYKDEVTVTLDSTGMSLHKRGYRRLESQAPIAENLAAALIMLTPWRKDRILIDPFCGSGTIPIEAAMIAANIAPGMNRHFNAEAWTHLITPQNWSDVREEAMEDIDLNIETDIQGYDIDSSVIEIARINAEKAGVGDLIHFQARDVAKLSHRKKYGFVITNPPYGERIGDKKELDSLYRVLGERYKELDDWSMFMITSYEKAQEAIGKKADKNRKIYNGMIKTYFYQYLGAKPPRRK
ncbi:THUMP domain-containing class I SAM-dependent RNA methyltransferase [Butyrivibrio sp. NC3005]|uniref:THUMP domain-containing class I SAM-dependent RNA methyltransferase n=1 Tax=Butyrivibrio sp. NC3005 TaxID=1280685 RepID=UPI0003F85C12|nr:class I SAM-dependent RNA methyltransferase [Butyrivibrio sp. NC3005]